MIFRIALMILTCGGFTLTSPAPSVGQDDNWHTSVEQAALESQRNGKKILVYVGAESCPYCRMMERDTWTDERLVKTLSAEFVLLKLSAEDDPELIDRLRVKSFPTTLFYSKERKLIARMQGYARPSDLFDAISELRVASTEVDAHAK